MLACPYFKTLINPSIMKNVLLLFLAFSLWACSESAPADETANGQDSAAQTETPETSDAPLSEPAAEPAPEPAGDEAPAEVRSEVYRSDQARPGVTAEFMQVDRNSDATAVVALWYWTDRDPEPMKLELTKSESYSGEEVGDRGTFRFPGEQKDSKFLIAEGMIDVTYADGTTQVFEIESE